MAAADQQVISVELDSDLVDDDRKAMALSKIKVLHPEQPAYTIHDFWPTKLAEVQALKVEDLKSLELPLARIKKIMKQDEDVKMISAEAPALFSKAAEIFIQEIIMRSWSYTEESKRRTLQRNDIAMAVSKHDTFDFLIDIVPREDLQKPSSSKSSNKQETVAEQNRNTTTAMAPDQVQYYLQLAAQQQQQQQQQTRQQQAGRKQQQAQVQQQQQQAQVADIVSLDGSGAAVAIQQQVPQILNQVNGGQGQAQQMIQLQAPTGQIQQAIMLTANQIETIRQQMASGINQPIVIQTLPTSTMMNAVSPQTTTTQSQEVYGQVYTQQPLTYLTPASNTATTAIPSAKLSRTPSSKISSKLHK